MEKKNKKNNTQASQHNVSQTPAAVTNPSANSRFLDQSTQASWEMNEHIKCLPHQLQRKDKESDRARS